MAFLLSDYTNLRELRRGGMGRVLIGEQKSLGRLVVIKEFALEPGADPLLVKRFETEARSAAALDHENVIRVFDFGQDKNAFYFSMEYVEGFNLEEMIGAENFDLTIALIIVLQSLKGLRYCHRYGMVHRDVKPANILISKSGSVKIADFGLVYASQIAQGLTASGVILGTPQYMSPEQVNGSSQPNPKMDIWAAGVILYRLLTGGQPFNGTTVTSLIYSIMETVPKNVADINTTIPENLSSLVMECLEKDPQNRPAIIDPLIEVLTDFIHAQGIRDPQEYLAAFLSTGEKPKSTKTSLSHSYVSNPVTAQTLTTGNRNNRTLVFAIAGSAGAIALAIIASIIFLKPQTILSTAKLVAQTETSQAALIKTNAHDSAETITHVDNRNSLMSIAMNPRKMPKIGSVPTKAVPALKPDTLMTPLSSDSNALNSIKVAPGTDSAIAVALTPAHVVTSTGILHVLSYPEAEIFVDNVLMGKSLSSNQVRVPVGNHTLTLKRKGYADYSKEIEIKKKELTEVKVRLEK